VQFVEVIDYSDEGKIDKECRGFAPLRPKPGIPNTKKKKIEEKHDA